MSVWLKRCESLSRKAVSADRTFYRTHVAFRNTWQLLIWTVWSCVINVVGGLLCTLLVLAELGGVGCCLKLFFLSAAHMAQRSDCWAETTTVWPWVTTYISSLTHTHIRIGRGYMMMVPLIVPPLFNRHLLARSEPLGHVLSFETSRSDLCVWTLSHLWFITRLFTVIWCFSVVDTNSWQPSWQLSFFF